MFTYTLRRLLIAIPTVLIISLVIFMLLELAPGDPMSDVPLTVPPEVKAKMREALGLDQPGWVRYLLWLKQFFWVEPLHLIDHWFGTSLRCRPATRDFLADPQPGFGADHAAPAADLWVVGMGYLVGVSLAMPIGVLSAYRQYSWFDQIGTFMSMIGFSCRHFLPACC
jgi:peptide/nickel transport system permease protein